MQHHICLSSLSVHDIIGLSGLIGEFVCLVCVSMITISYSYDLFRVASIVLHRILITYRLRFCGLVTVYKGYIRPILNHEYIEYLFLTETSHKIKS